MKAIMVCVDYSDLLRLTLPYNRHHFKEVLVVTTYEDHDTHRVAFQYGAKVYATDSFYNAGAVFNKWKALEEGLDRIGREGWLCIMDADVAWPKELPPFQLDPGTLYTPFRRMKEDVPDVIPPESEWLDYPRHRQQREFAGYSQIFHADDQRLPDPPWHQVNWRHAGGADSFFQRHWPDAYKVRPPFEVLHLGPAGRNWCGRSTPFKDGSVPKEAEERQRKLQAFMQSRRRNRQGPDPFVEEKLTDSD